MYCTTRRVCCPLPRRHTGSRGGGTATSFLPRCTCTQKKWHKTKHGIPLRTELSPERSAVRQDMYRSSVRFVWLPAHVALLRGKPDGKQKERRTRRDLMKPEMVRHNKGSVVATRPPSGRVFPRLRIDSYRRVFTCSIYEATGTCVCHLLQNPKKKKHAHTTF